MGLVIETWCIDRWSTPQPRSCARAERVFNIGAVPAPRRETAPTTALEKVTSTPLHPEAMCVNDTSTDQVVVLHGGGWALASCHLGARV